jgi:hypothetical protein
MRIVRSGLSVTVSPSSAKASTVASLAGRPGSSGSKKLSASSGGRSPNRYSAKSIAGAWMLRNAPCSVVSCS